MIVSNLLAPFYSCGNHIDGHAFRISTASGEHREDRSVEDINEESSIACAMPNGRPFSEIQTLLQVDMTAGKY